MSRCTQQQALYAAEEQVERGRVFGSLAELRDWVELEVVGTAWWQDRYPRVRLVEVPDITRRAGEGSVGHWYSDSDSGVIEMHRVHWNGREVLHELAHVCAAPLGSSSHDPLFAREYLTLVRQFLSFPAFAELERAFTRAGIVIAP